MWVESESTIWFSPPYDKLLSIYPHILLQLRFQISVVSKNDRCYATTIICLHIFLQFWIHHIDNVMLLQFSGCCAKNERGGDGERRLIVHNEKH